jgi:hypothetical protein
MQVPSHHGRISTPCGAFTDKNHSEKVMTFGDMNCQLL